MKTLEKKINTNSIPEPFMTEGEKKEFEQAKEIIINNRHKKVKDAIYDLKYYSDKYNVLDMHLPDEDKKKSWHFNNSLESIKEAAKSLLENLELLNNKKEKDGK